mmetsp:Transcript_4460/g.15491  ORF Transcript_4460/g.15491 Transcript_4460/m.15491 type:complete len:227 (+) Transcript_4460:624-1304(+)
MMSAARLLYSVLSLSSFSSCEMYLSQKDCTARRPISGSSRSFPTSRLVPTTPLSRFCVESDSIFSNAAFSSRPPFHSPFTSARTLVSWPWAALVLSRAFSATSWKSDTALRKSWRHVLFASMRSASSVKAVERSTIAFSRSSCMSVSLARSKNVNLLSSVGCTSSCFSLSVKSSSSSRNLSDCSRSFLSFSSSFTLYGLICLTSKMLISLTSTVVSDIPSRAGNRD